MANIILTSIHTVSLRIALWAKLRLNGKAGAASDIPVPTEQYIHWHGEHVTVLYLAWDTKKRTQTVVYYHKASQLYFVIPLSEWMRKTPTGEPRYRKPLRIGFPQHHGIVATPLMSQANA